MDDHTTTDAIRSPLSPGVAAMADIDLAAQVVAVSYQAALAVERKDGDCISSASFTPTNYDRYDAANARISAGMADIILGPNVRVAPAAPISATLAELPTVAHNSIAPKGHTVAPRGTGGTHSTPQLETHGTSSTTRSACLKGGTESVLGHSYAIDLTATNERHTPPPRGVVSTHFRGYSAVVYKPAAPHGPTGAIND